MSSINDWKYPDTNDWEHGDEIYQVPKILNHPNYYQVEKNIHVIKNFTTQEERDWFVALAESAPEENWWKDKRKWWTGKILYVGDENTGNRHIVNILSRIRNLFDDEREEKRTFGGMISVHRMKPGEAMFLHADNPSGTDGTTNYVQFGMTMYHTDFNGGEIFYENLNLSYKPQKGDLLMHPGITHYQHRTLPVLLGPNRYISTTFAFDPAVKRLREQKLVFADIKTGAPDNSHPDPITFYQTNQSSST